MCRVNKEMQSIELKSDGYTYKYDFTPTPSTDETFTPNHIVYIEPRSSATECLDICLDFFGAFLEKAESKRHCWS